MLVPGVTPARAIHLVEMRSALSETYRVAVRTPPTYTDPTIAVGQTSVRAAHFEELRAAVRALE